jgi:cytochrome P450
VVQNGRIALLVDGLPVRAPLGPRELPLVGNHFELYPDVKGNYARLFDRYGSVVKTTNMGTTIYVTNDPAVSEVVLGENEFFTKRTSNPSHPLHYMRDQTALFSCDTASPAFKAAHKFIPPSMSPKAAQNFSPSIQEAVEACFSVLDELDSKQQAFHVYQYMFKLAGQIIYKVVLGLDTQHFSSPSTPPHQIIRLLGTYLELMKQTSLSPQWFKHLPYSKVHRVGQLRQKLADLVSDAVQKCEPGGNGQDMPIKEAALNSTCIADYLRRATDEQGEKLPHEHVISNLATLLGAGLNTSSALLSWLIYALCKYPGNEERLLKELVHYRRVSSAEDMPWSHDDVLSMPFLDAFVKETLRMHSPTFQTARSTKCAVVVPGGWHIPAGAVVIPTFPALHRNKDHWDNPDRFDPDRWLVPAADRHRMAYTPFAAGPRGCVGYNVARLEAKLALANLVYRYRFVDASREPVEYDPEFVVIRPLNSYARAVKRTTWPCKMNTG